MTDNTPSFIPIFDGHNDTLLRYVRQTGYDFFQRQPGGHLDAARIREGGFGGGFFAIFCPNARDPQAPPPDFSQYNTEDGYAVPLPPPIELTYAQPMMMQMAAQLFRIEAASQNPTSDIAFKVVRTADELAHCLQQGIIAAILHVEGAEMIDENLDALEVLYQAGLRSLGPVWSRPNTFAEGVPFQFPHSPDTGPGLTDAGKALVRACNRLGVLIDLSHINAAGFWDVAKLSDAPLVATHSNVHTLCPSTRNLTDDQLSAIKDSDGMVGLNFAVSFLREDGANDSDTPLSVMVRHIDYLVEKLGIDRVGFGSDFDGATIPQGIGDAAGLPNLLEALRQAGYSEVDLRKIAHENWLRVLRQTWK